MVAVVVEPAPLALEMVWLVSEMEFDCVATLLLVVMGAEVVVHLRCPLGWAEEV